MDEENKDDVQAQQPDNVNQESGKNNGIDQEALSKMLDERLESERRKWQSKIDTILAEKKQSETKALTVEEQIEQLKAEREKERVDWTRKEARAKAGIDESLDQALSRYYSRDPEQITSGASEIRAIFDKTTDEYKKKIDELEKLVKYAGKTPAGGSTEPGKRMSLKEFTALKPKEQNAFILGGGEIGD